MRVLIRQPGDESFRTILVPNKLGLLQDLVDGPIETVTIATDCCLICNEEGRIRGLEHNCYFCGIGFVGTILVVGIDGEEFTDCPLSVDMANSEVEE